MRRIAAGICSLEPDTPDDPTRTWESLSYLPAAPLTQNGNAGYFDAAGQSGVVVFNINAAVLSSHAFANFSLTNAQNAAAIVINVDTSGTNGTANFTAGNFLAQTFSDFANRLVWNFEGAENILVQRELFGAMIAMDARLHNQTNLNGSIAVGAGRSSLADVRLRILHPDPAALGSRDGDGRHAADGRPPASSCLIGFLARVRSQSKK